VHPVRGAASIEQSFIGGARLDLAAAQDHRATMLFRDDPLFGTLMRL
jgi:hypothetical protein